MTSSTSILVSIGLELGSAIGPFSGSDSDYGTGLAFSYNLDISIATLLASETVKEDAYPPFSSFD